MRAVGRQHREDRPVDVLHGQIERGGNVQYSRRCMITMGQPPKARIGRILVHAS